MMLVTSTIMVTTSTAQVSAIYLLVATTLTVTMAVETSLAKATVPPIVASAAPTMEISSALAIAITTVRDQEKIPMDNDDIQSQIQLFK